jgi:DNA-binding MarR family transcriptional regulator
MKKNRDASSKRQSRKPGRPELMQPNDYRALAEFRYQLRLFLRFSEESARNAGLEPQQHQLLLAIKGMPAGEPATVNVLAERLQLRQNSVVELIDRCVLRGLVERSQLESDRREVMVTLTPSATTVLRTVSNRNRQELENMGPALLSSLRQVMRQVKRPASRGTTGTTAA